MDAPKGLSRKRARAHRAEQARARRDVGAVAAVYALAIATVFVLLGADEMAFGARLVVENGLLVAVGAAGVAILGTGALRASFAAPPRPPHFPLAVLAAALMLAGGFAWVHFVAAASGRPRGIAFGTPSLALLVELAVLPALVEEWLCRGVLWTACSRLTTPRRTVAATALLFAFLHAPAWGLLGLPHRAVGGVVLGELRARTGSLVPCALAHFLNNAVAAAAISG